MELELHDAEKRTEDWQRRHSPDSIRRIGAWRWKGVRAEAEYILGRLAFGNVVDFGGFDGPLGFGSIVVDSKGPVRRLSDLQVKVPTIFTSHTLEHCEDINGTLRDIADILADDGVLIAHVPSWTCRRWREGEYHNPKQGMRHHWTFSLFEDKPAFTGGVITMIDEKIRRIVGPLRAGGAYHCGDDSLMIIAQKA